ncbi:MAG TPA: amidase [Nocardioidaceae bacterium]|nr:amidase [Nocardioidaceae bacterium]
MTDDLLFAGVERLAEATRSGEVSARELTEACLARIDATNGRLNAFTNVMRDKALAEADARDKARADGRGLGPLHGVPVAIKEELDVEGEVTTFGGRSNVTPAPRDAEVVRRLRHAGAVVVGKTAMPEFGQWPFTESVAYGMTRNPWDTDRSTGGSSGGTAAAVASGMVPVGMGGDGGGSIRIPSMCCGLYGLKPQRGRVSSDPNPHLWWALGTTGPLARSVMDSAIVYDVIRGALPGDRFRAGEPSSSFVDAARATFEPLRIAWSTKPATLGVKPDPENVAAVKATAELLSSIGHKVVEVDPGYPDTTAAFVPQFFGGVAAEADIVEHPERLERRTRETLRLGRWVRPAVVEWAMRQGEKVAAKANRVFDRYDLLLTPVIAQRPPEVGVLDGVGTIGATLRSMPMIAYTALWNVTGNPAASVPAGFGSDGLPLGVQLVGRPGDEPTVLTVSAQLEQARPWADARPVVA